MPCMPFAMAVALSAAAMNMAISWRAAIDNKPCLTLGALDCQRNQGRGKKRRITWRSLVRATAALRALIVAA